MTVNLDSLKILVLNYSYEPLQFCSAKRAIVMVLTGRAESLELDGCFIRSPSTTFRLPTVIRTLKMVRRRRRKGISFSKKNILRRDNYTCQYCGDNSRMMTVDHILPKSRGGKTNWVNVVVACKPCNLKKGDRRLQEIDMSLVRKPFKPDYELYPFQISAGSPSHVEAWKKYLPKKLFLAGALN